MNLRDAVSHASRSARSAFNHAVGYLRRPRQAQDAIGHGGASLQEGMWVRRHWDRRDKPKEMTRVLSPSEIELHFGDGVHDRVLAEHYMPVRSGTRPRRR